LTLWFCQKCVLLGGKDCGPWDDENKFFPKIKSAHRGHVGFKIGEPKAKPRLKEIEQTFTEFFNANIDQWFHQLTSDLKGPEKLYSIKAKWKEVGNA
jgi:hypothetical protein